MSPRSLTRRADALALALAVPLLFLLVVVTFAATDARELSNRGYCAANLRGISQSLNIYAADNADIFALIPSSSATKYRAAFKPEEVDQNADATLNAYYRDQKDKPLQPNDITANLWILVLKNQVAPKQFLCKSDPWAAKTAAPQNVAGKYRNNFEPATTSYSFIYPWTQDKAGKIVPGNWWKSVTDSTLVIGADMAPYMDPAGNKDEVVTINNMTVAPAPADSAPASSSAPAKGQAKVDHGLYFGLPPEPFKVNSTNHRGEGQTVVYSDVHAEFDRTSLVGQNEENIWTVTVKDNSTAISAGDIGIVLPNDDTNIFDVVLVPARDLKGKIK
jgi:hypothetical protein